MKKYVVLLLATLCFSWVSIYGQVADGISYQAVALDDKGKEIAGHDINGLIIHSKQIAVRFSIINMSEDGETLYSEVHSTYTDQYGQFSLVIGHGEVSSEGTYQSLMDINWGAEKLFLKVEIDIRSTGEFKLMGIQQMMAVPFAFHSFSTSKAIVNYAEIIDKPLLSIVSSTGDYNDLLNKPVLFSGIYDDLLDKPTLFDGNYNSLTNKPVIPTKATDLINNAGYLTSFTENDPIWSIAAANYYTKSNMQTSGASQVHFGNLTNKPTTLAGYGITDAFNGNWSGLSGKPTTLAGYGITDAMSTSSPANGITNANIANWNTAFSWGNHVGLYRPITYVPSWTEITSKPFLFTSVANNQLIKYNSTSGRWENWTPNFLTGYTETDPAWTIASANYYTKFNLQTSGASQVHFSNLTNKPTTLAGYGITDAMNTDHAANAITSLNISKWDTAYIWGNHAKAGYQPFIAVGTDAQYWRGDKTWQPLNSASVGLGNVENIQLSTWFGSPSLTILGNVTSGIWNAGPVFANGEVTAIAFVKPGGTASQFLKADGSVDANTYITAIREVADEFTSTAAQTSFTLTQVPSVNSKVKMYVNGVRISNTAYNVSGSVLTYVPVNNGSYMLEAGDRIQLDYYY